MTPSRMGVLIAVWVVGLPAETAAQAPGMRLNEPFKSAPANVVLASVELTKVELTRAPTAEETGDRLGRQPEPILDEAAQKVADEQRCEEAEPAPLRAAPPEPLKMQQFPAGQVLLRWTASRQGLTRQTVLFEQAGRQIDLLKCLRLPPLERKPPAP
jgi:hypothetical protein